MKSTNIFLAIPYSLFSPSFYREVGGTWRAKGFVYLLLILVVYCLLWVLLLSHVVGRLEGVMQTHIIPQMPTITFSQGVASVNQKMPIYIQWDKYDKNSAFLMIDTRENPASLQQSSAVVSLQKTKLLFKESENKISQKAYPVRLNMVLTQQEMNTYLARTVKWLSPLGLAYAFTIGLFAMYFFNIIVAFIYAFIGFWFNALHKAKLDYLSILNVVFVAFTPTLILRSIFLWLPFRLPYAVLIYTAITISYLFFGIKANRRVS
ncbi:MAG: DUF1189 family protein [Pseudomonadota bacterium]